MGDRSVKLGEFSGNIDTDKMTVYEYLSHVEMSRIAGGWDDPVTAEKVKLKLTGPARTWLQNRINDQTPGLAAFEPEAVNGIFPPGLRALLIRRFMPQHSASEHDRLRRTMIQGPNESVQEFYDRVESIQFIFDQELPDDFRRTSKASYDIVHNHLVRNGFLNGLKAEIKRHVELADVATTEQSLAVAMAFEKAQSPNKSGAVHGASADETSLDARIAALELQRQQRNSGDQRGNTGKLADEGCFYCGYIGHIKKVCRIREGDEAKGIFRQRAEGYQPGRVGKRGGQRGGGPPRGGGPQRGGYFPQRGGYNQTRGGYASRSRGNQRGYGFNNRGGGFAHATGQSDFLPQQTFSTTQPAPGMQMPVVPMPGWNQMGFPQGPSSHSSSPSMDMSQYFGPGLGSIRFNPEN